MKPEFRIRLVKILGWSGVLLTVIIIIYIESLRQLQIAPPIPFLLLYASIVFTAIVGGVRAALASAFLVTVFIIYSAITSFGPPTLTGGFFQVALGSTLVFVTAFFLGQLKDRNKAYVKQLKRKHEIERETDQETLFLLSSALEQMAEHVFITDKNGNIEYVNRAFEEFTGYSEADVLGETPRILKSGLHKPDFYRLVWNTLLSGKPFKGTFINRKKDGEIYYESKRPSSKSEMSKASSHK